MKNKKYLISILLITIVLSWPLLLGNVVKGHDYPFHYTNVAAGLNLIKNGNISLRKIFILKGLANGAGYGTGIFYPPLSYTITSYIALILELFNLPINYSLSIYNILIIFFSALSMFYVLKNIFKNKNLALIGAASYVSFPYFICDIYTRAAIGEQLTFIFIPLALYSIYDLIYDEGKKFKYLFVTSYVGMIYSHTVLTIYLTIYILMFLILNIKKVIKTKKILELSKASVIVLLITSPYLITLFGHKILGNYVVYQPYNMYSVMQLHETSLYIRDLFLTKYKSTDGIVVFLNYNALIFSIVSLIKIKKLNISKDNKKILKDITIITTIFLFMLSKYHSWDNEPLFMKMIQFSWRLMVYIDIYLAITCGLFVIEKNKRNAKKTTLIATSIIVLFGTFTINKYIYSPAGEDQNQNNMGTAREYLPVNARNNYEYSMIRGDKIIIKAGKATISDYQNTNNEIKAQITDIDGSLAIEIPRIYYLGYKVKLKNKNGEVKKIDYYENNNGFIEFKIFEEGQIEVKYTGMTLANIFKIISYITIILCVYFWIIENKYIQNKLKEKREENEKKSKEQKK